MSRVQFRAGRIQLELSGSEAFVTRMLLLFADSLGPVDRDALAEAPAVSPSPAGFVRPNGAPVVRRPGDGLAAFFRSHEPSGKERQAEAALLFAYYLHEREGMRALQVKDLIRCCIRTGVDTRNFNLTLGALTRRGLLETLRHGHAYRLSEQGVATVENRLE